METYVYDSQANLVQEVFTDSATAQITNRSLYTYNAQNRNTLGQLLLQRTARPGPGIVSEILNLPGLPDGVFSVRLHTPERTIVKRLVKEWPTVATPDETKSRSRYRGGSFRVYSDEAFGSGKANVLTPLAGTGLAKHRS